MADIKSTLFNLTRNLSKTSGDLVKTTKLSVGLAQEQEALRNLYTEIGKKVHEIYQYGGSLGKFFDEKYKEIEAAERKIDELKESIGKIKGVKECPKCGKQVDKTAEFCPKCGLRMDSAPAVSESAAPGGSATLSESAAPKEAAPTGLPADALPLSVPVSAPPPEIETKAPLPPEVPAEKITAASPPKVFCRVCGAENDPGTKFCLSCGRIL